jgi:DNA-binding NarL/FixJ family response regulator
MVEKSRVWVVHSDALLSAGIASVLNAGDEFEPVIVERGSSEDLPLDRSLSPVEVVIADYDAGMRLMRSCVQARSVLIITRDDSERRVRAALEAGVRGYLLVGCGAADLVGAVRAVGRGGVALAAAITARVAESFTRQVLTPMQLKVLATIAAGLSNKAIAKQLSTSEGTVKSHVKAIFAKLQAENRTHAVAIARQRGLVEHAELDFAGRNGRLLTQLAGAVSARRSVQRLRQTSLAPIASRVFPANAAAAAKEGNMTSQGAP